MKIRNQVCRIAAVLVVLGLYGSIPGFAQDGKLVIHVTPKQAYAFVDGHPFAEATRHALRLSAGDHKIDLYNYGYAPASKSVSITAGKTTSIDVTLTAVDSTVPGPRGAMTIENADRDAVFLNGKTPEFFVGHGDEFNHDWWWKQELVVPPGNYLVTVMDKEKEIWSGPVNVPANQRVVLDIPGGVRKTVPWPRGEKLASVPRFKAGTASATVAVAKPTAELSASSVQVNCGDSAQLKWSSTDTGHVEISNIGGVTASGEKSVEPKQTTAYQLTAVGPGGTVTSSSTVAVNTSIQANLGISPAEVHYKRVGDKVVEQNGAALNWSASNSNAVSIDPFGTVAANGGRSIQGTPRKTDPGPVDETVTYTLSASNACGGTDTRTAKLHIIGDIEAAKLETKLALNSIYFPTNHPTPGRPKTGLLASQQNTLKVVADDFKKYLAEKPDAKLILGGYADERGTKEYNQPLSERRAALAKSYLVEQGVPADNLEIQAHGAQQNMDAAQIKQEIEQNPALSANPRLKVLATRIQTVALANNRRVDMSLSTTGQESVRQYPFQAEDVLALVSREPIDNAGK